MTPTVIDFKAAKEKREGDAIARLINYLLATGRELVLIPIANQNRKPHG